MTIVVEKKNNNFEPLKKTIKWLVFYFPVRYMLCGVFFAVIFLSYVQSIKAIEGQALVTLLKVFHVSSIYLQNGNLYVGSVGSPSKLALYLPVYSQTIFLIFFPTVALSARMNFKMRGEILLFGLLCFLIFILIQFLTIIAMLNLGLIMSHNSYSQASIFLTVTFGGLIIDSALFTMVTKPKRIKIKPIIKRSFSKEYAYLTIQFVSSFLVIYFLLNVLIFNVLQVGKDSPLVAILSLHFNITSLLFVSYFLSYLFYGARLPNWFRFVDPHRPDKGDYNPPLTFLVPAYNEEKFIRMCLESIDKACSKYPGRSEIIIVNDGSTDQTSEMATEAIRNLKYCSGKLFELHNTGKGLALNLGLQNSSGEIIVRIDGDSVIAEDAIYPIINHFRDPQVACVSGMILPLEQKSTWQKAITLVYINFFYIIRRGQELVDSILVQSGAYSVFRKDALIKIGGWVDNIFGEDGEITHRLGRYGYKLEFEPKSFVYSSVPESLFRLMDQRTRWGIAFYHGRGRNLELVRDLREYRTPRAFVFLIAMISHGIGFGQSMALPFFAGSIITGIYFSIHHFNLLWLERLIMLEFLFYGLSITMFIYFLAKLKIFSYIKYFPLMRVFGFVVRLFVKPHAMDIILYWSSKWKEYNNESYQDLRREVRRVDPANY